ncbi:MAG: GtrA family protein [Anaerolineae bacterium]
MPSVDRKSFRAQVANVRTPFRIRDRVRRRVPPAHRREAKRFIKFAIVGSIGFLIDTGTLYALVFLLGMRGDAQRPLAKGISFLLAVTSNFIWNRRWTYPESRSKPLSKQMTQFFTMNLIGLGINLGVFTIVDSLLVPLVDLKLAVAGAQIAAVGIAMLWNFTANRLVTYNDVKFGK